MKAINRGKKMYSRRNTATLARLYIIFWHGLSYRSGSCLRFDRNEMPGFRVKSANEL